MSRTFEGRDRFAPAAAWVAKGLDLGEFGPAIADPVRLDWPEPVEHDDVLEGGVVATDRFGNLVTSLARARVEAFARGGPVDIEAGDRRLRLVATYAEIGPGELCALYGSTDLLEIAAASAPAAGQPGFDAGLRVRLRRRPALC
jgi:S-adenosylmethionine hydrolase